MPFAEPPAAGCCGCMLWGWLLPAAAAVGAADGGDTAGMGTAARRSMPQQHGTYRGGTVGRRLRRRC
eukprot:gene17288-17339_t